MAVDIEGTIRGFIPSFGRSFGFSIITWIIVFIIFLALVVVASWFFLRRMKFNKQIIIFEKIAGRFEPTRKDRAMEVKFSTAGDTIFYLRKHKKYMPSPTIQTGRRVYWYFIRSDDEWINFGPGDFDEDARKMGAHFLDKEMRFARTQVQKGLKDRYDKPGFWRQYGLLIMSLGFITIIGVMVWLSLDKFIEIINHASGTIGASEKVIDKVDLLLGKVDNICAGGSGIR